MLRYLNSGLRFYGDNPIYPYARNYPEFQLIASGTACAWYENPAQNAPPDPASPRLWVHAKHQIHGWRDRKGGRSEICVFQFTTPHPLIGDLLREKPALSIPVNAKAVRDIRAWAENARTFAARDTPENLLSLEKIHLDLSILVLRHVPSKALNQSLARAEQRVEEACSLYIGNLRNPLSVDEIATEIGISPPHLRRLFRQVKGCSPKEVFTEIRMNIARRRLLLGEETVAELSDRLGFSEPSAFSRAYTAAFGHSPRRAGKRS
jgi:AraC family transcriptional regulator